MQTPDLLGAGEQIIDTFYLLAPNISQRWAVLGDLRLEKNFLPEYFLQRLQILSDPAVKSRLILLARSCKKSVIISTLSQISQAFTPQPTPSQIRSDSVLTDMNAHKLTGDLLLNYFLKINKYFKQLLQNKLMQMKASQDIV